MGVSTYYLLLICLLAFLTLDRIWISKQVIKEQEESEAEEEVKELWLMTTRNDNSRDHHNFSSFISKTVNVINSLRGINTLSSFNITRFKLHPNIA